MYSNTSQQYSGRQNYFYFQGLFYNAIHVIRSAQYLIDTFSNINVMFNII